MFRTLSCGRLQALCAPFCPLLWVVVLVVSVAASGNAASNGTTVAPYAHADKVVRLLAHVDGNSAWHATANDDFAAARVVIADDGGVMMIVPPRGAQKPHRVYLYDRNGQWQTIAVQQMASFGGPTASLGRYFTWSWNGWDSAAGIYAIDTSAGYAGVPVARLSALPHTDKVSGVNGAFPTRLADGRVALSISGIVSTILERGTMWGILDPVSGDFEQWAATTNIDSNSFAETLWSASFTPAKSGLRGGFLGCANMTDGGTGPHRNALHIPAPGYYFAKSNMDPDHDGSIDAQGNLAWFDDSYSTPAIHIDLTDSTGQLTYGGSWGFDRVLDNSSIEVAALGPSAAPHAVYQVNVPPWNEQALYATDVTLPDHQQTVRRIIGQGDTVKLENRKVGLIDADDGDVLYPHFSMNTHGDIVFIANLTKLDPRRGFIAAGQGLIMVEHGIFSDGFD